MSELNFQRQLPRLVARCQGNRDSAYADCQQVAPGEDDMKIVAPYWAMANAAGANRSRG